MGLLDKIIESAKKQRAVNSGEEYIEPPEPAPIPLAEIPMSNALDLEKPKPKAKPKPKGILTIDGAEYAGDNFAIKGKCIYIDNKKSIECSDDAPMVINEVSGVIQNLVIAHPVTIEAMSTNASISTTSSVVVNGSATSVTGSKISIGKDVNGDVDGEAITIGGTVGGNVDASEYIKCGNVSGNASGNSISVTGDVGGDIESDESIKCGNVGGNVDAGTSVNSGDVGGNVDVGESMQCGNVGGTVDVGDSLKCNDVNGDIDCGGDAIINSMSSGTKIESGGTVSIGKIN
jgi:hypothetical protein